MMVSMEQKMDEMPENGGSMLRNGLGIALAGTFMVLTAGAIVGFTAAATEDGEPLTAVGMLILAAFVAIIAGLAFAIYRMAKNLKASSGPATKRERLNRNIMIFCAIAGGLTGLILAMSDGVITDVDAAQLAVFSNTPLPMTVALLLAAFWGIAMPVIAWFWHTRAIDEQEAAAYRDGGYYAAYAYLVGAPVWWMLWRGGLLPEPDGIAIFVAVASIWTAVWFWKKYR